jgi:hypothetical protein
MRNTIVALPRSGSNLRSIATCFSSISTSNSPFPRSFCLPGTTISMPWHSHRHFPLGPRQDQPMFMSESTQTDIFSLPTYSTAIQARGPARKMSPSGTGVRYGTRYGLFRSTRMTIRSRVPLLRFAREVHAVRSRSVQSARSDLGQAVTRTKPTMLEEERPVGPRPCRSFKQARGASSR